MRNKKKKVKVTGGLYTRVTVIETAIGNILKRVMRCLVILGILTVAYMMKSQSDRMDDLVNTYKSLDNKVSNSKENFNKRVGTVTRNDDGSYAYSFEFIDLNKKENVQGNTYVSHGNILVTDLTQFTEMKELMISAGGEFESSAERIALFWDICMANGFSQNFTIGLIANSLCEGNFGQLEGNKAGSYPGWFSDYGSWDGQTLIVRKFYEWETLMNFLHSSDNDTDHWFGIGCIQWSYSSRRANLTSYYDTYFEQARAANVNNDPEFDVTEWVAKAELEFMVSEVRGYMSDIDGLLGRHYGIVEGSSADYAAAICDRYEAPARSCNGQIDLSDNPEDDQNKQDYYIRDIDGIDTELSIETVSEFLMGHRDCGMSTSSIWQCGKRAAYADELVNILNQAGINEEMQFPEAGEQTQEGGN